MQHPRPHAFAAAVQRAARDFRGGLGIPTVSSVCLWTRSSSLIGASRRARAGADLALSAVPVLGRSRSPRRLRCSLTRLDIETSSVHDRGTLGEACRCRRPRLRWRHGRAHRRTSTPSSPPAASAAGCGRSRAPTRRSSCTTSPGPASSLLRDTWDRLEPLSGPDRIAVVTGRAHRAAVEAQLPGIADKNVVPRVRAARLGRRDRARRRDPAPPRARRDHRLVRRRPRHPRHAGVRLGGAAGRRGRPRGLHLHDRHPADRARRRLRLHQEGPASSSSTGAPEAVARRALRREARPRRPRRSTSPTAPTSGTRACSSRAPTCCSARSPRTSPQLHAGLMDLAEAWDDRERRGPVVDRVWPTLPKIAIDYVVAEPAAAKGRLAVVPGHFDWDDVGDFAEPREAQLAAGARTTSRSSARTRACSPTPPAASSSARRKRVISLIGVQGHRRRRHRRRAAGHHERARAAGEGRGRRAQAHRPRRRALTRLSDAQSHGSVIRTAVLRLCNHSRAPADPVCKRGVTVGNFAPIAREVRGHLFVEA